ncbi:Non-specific serine/threonine protein kinase protein [Dioscorea alata]|uniref:Non-specific serine/threonine protein kinase protein n=1 Tax=Dioscorea alata TaxID=55571 RepID=A0ACB7UAB4_DIOAL|nr:Non-specific serine/threonine protein kinase protein [Dioscorea alata]
MKIVHTIYAVVILFLLLLMILLRILLGASKAFFLIANIEVSSIFSAFIISILQFTLNIITPREQELQLEYSYLRHIAGLPKNFRYEELSAATNNFQNQIGRGGSGSVFRGVLSDGSQIAVKRIEGEVRGEREFWNELVAIATVQHFNLVRLLGCCLIPGDHLRYLVYEFIENGSLDSWLFKKNNREEQEGDEVCLAWPLRYQVAVDVAKALAYLHHDCRLKILHLDIKPENILLDTDFRGHLTDFGISRLMKREETSVLTTVRGTRGYLAPEWFFGDGISEKSDVYSYGMVLLELVGGQRNMKVIHEGEENISTMRFFCFPRIVNEKMREGKVMEVVDERLVRRGDVVEKEVKALVCIGLWCIQERPEVRPSMELVVDMLEGHVDVSMPPETRMFMDGSIREEVSAITSFNS